MASRKDQIRSGLLILQYRRGNAQALEELIAIWERPLFYYIRRLVDSEEDAWDALQDVWAKVIRKAWQLRDPSAVSGWLYKIARNCAISFMRNNPSFAHVEEEENPLPFADERTNPEAQFETQQIHWGLDQISLPHREVLTLKFLEGFSLMEIGEIVDAPVGTVKSRLHHAKAALRKVLEKEADRHG